VLRDISFESGSPHNIYDPHFTSEEVSNLGSLNDADLEMIKDSNSPIRTLTQSEADLILGDSSKKYAEPEEEIISDQRVIQTNWNRSYFKPHDISQIPKVHIADSLVTDEYGGGAVLGRRNWKSMSKSDASSTSSVPSVAEERDTISFCTSTNAAILTPSNVSRVMHNLGSFNAGRAFTGAGQGGVIFCDQPSMMTQETGNNISMNGQ
jgi:hypothetical protein